jgi:putative ABC transport system permease protein
MRWIYKLPLRLRSLFRKSRVENDLNDELRFHLEKLIEENVGSGMTPEEARYAALREFGGVEQMKEECRDSWGIRMISELVQDIRYGLRQLRRNPGFTVVAVLTLALGIGANTAIFSVVNAVLLRPLPFSAPDQLVSVNSHHLHKTSPNSASYPDFDDWRTRNHVFTQMAAYHTDSFTLTGHGEAARIQGAVVSADLFSLLGVHPVLGRDFLPEEDKLPAANGGFAVVLSHRLWRDHFGADREIVGKSIDLDNRSFIVVGIAPAGFQFPVEGSPVDFWTTIAVDRYAPPGQASMAEQRGAHFLDVIARLKPNVTVAKAQAEMSTIVSAMNGEHPENFPRAVSIIPELDNVVGLVRPALLILLAAVGCVLLIACANVANLLLARGAARRKEVAVRGALGAGRRRIIRQLLTESLMLASLGGALGTGLAFWGVPALVGFVPEQFPRLAGIHLSVAVLLFTTFLSLLTGVVFGLAPALQISRWSLVGSLKESGRGSSEGLRSSRLRGSLVASGVAVAATLLVGAGLLIQSFLRLERVDPGFNPHQLLTFRVDLPYARYSGPRQTGFFQEAALRLTHLPGVRSASAVFPLPLSGDEVSAGFDIEGRPTDNARRPRTNYSWVEPGYFHTAGIPLLSGRDFTARDDLKTMPVAIISETLARRFFPGENPVGRRIKPGIGNGYAAPPMREIIGVVGNVKQNGLAAEPGPEVYAPLGQSPLGSMSFIVRTQVDPLTVAAAARKTIAEMDKDLPVYGLETLEHYVAQTYITHQLLTLLLGIFAALAPALATVGLYGVISYSASQRTHEIGVRMALGAEKSDVLKMVIGQGLKPALIGVGIGIAGALALTRFLSSLLYGVKPTDPLTFIAVSLILIAVALVACYIPARRAAKVDPIVALRYE